MNYEIRPALGAEADAILELFPRLAAFDLPPERVPEDLWRGNAHLLQRWAAGELPACLVYVAAGDDGTVLGVAMARLGEELLSHAPSAHLEVLVVRDIAEGQGIGAALMREMERAVRAAGAQSMTLHVFASNTRARAVYERAGYTGELMRYIKHFS
jgi:ribosomal protein S18 acetylase RimI-like enzyme